METDSTLARDNVTFLLNMGLGIMISDALLAMLWGSKLGLRDIWKQLQSKANQGPLGRPISVAFEDIQLLHMLA